MKTLAFVPAGLLLLLSACGGSAAPTSDTVTMAEAHGSLQLRLYWLETPPGYAPATKLVVEALPNVGRCASLAAKATVNGVALRASSGGLAHDDGEGFFGPSTPPSDYCMPATFVMDDPAPEVVGQPTEVRVFDDTGVALLRVGDISAPPAVTVESPLRPSLGDTVVLRMSSSFEAPDDIRWTTPDWTSSFVLRRNQGAFTADADGKLTFVVPAVAPGGGALLLEAPRDIQGRPEWRVRVLECSGAATCTAARRAEPNMQAIAPDHDAPLDDDPGVTMTVGR